MNRYQAVGLVYEAMQQVIFEGKKVRTLKLKWNVGILDNNAKGIATYEPLFFFWERPVILLSNEICMEGNIELLNIIAHELVHIKQFVFEGLVTYPGGMYYWKNGYNNHHMVDKFDDYMLSPWEMEARALSEWLVQKALNNIYAESHDTYQKICDRLEIFKRSS